MIATRSLRVTEVTRCTNLVCSLWNPLPKRSLEPQFGSGKLGHFFPWFSCWIWASFWGFGMAIPSLEVAHLTGSIPPKNGCTALILKNQPTKIYKSVNDWHWLFFPDQLPFRHRRGQMALIGGSVSQRPEADMDMSKSVGHLSGIRFRKVNQLIVFFCMSFGFQMVSWFFWLIWIRLHFCIPRERPGLPFWSFWWTNPETTHCNHQSANTHHTFLHVWLKIFAQI